MKKRIGRLCVITDTTVQNKFSHIELAKMAAKSGADIIQFRDKNLSTSGMLDTAIEIRNICRKAGVTFIVNDRVDIALLSDADGVHLGIEDIPIDEARKVLGRNKIIGGTAHNLREAINAERDGADYIGFGHIYKTSSKKKFSKPKGILYLKKIISNTKIPVMAIGGIGIGNIDEVISAGTHGVAVINSVVCSENPALATRKLKERFS